MIFIEPTLNNIIHQRVYGIDIALLQVIQGSIYGPSYEENMAIYSVSFVTHSN
jgi:hypothetical protein